MVSRKSRKNLIAENGSNKKVIKTVGYIRLSVSKRNAPSDSVENQRKIIEEYISSKSYLQFEKFYVDENASGRNLNRPAFNEMMNDLNGGKFDCIIVKDLSRLGRSMIDVGYCVQMLFPSKKVRFISIGNQIDTLNGMTNITFNELPGNRIPLTSLMNEQYAVDASRNTKLVLKSYINSGKYVAPKAPYGFKKSEEDCHALIVDIEAAMVVKKIFLMAAKGDSINKIIRHLNEQSILTPINYAIEQGLKGNYKQGTGLWNSRTVRDILTNRTYTGDLEQGTEKTLIPNTHKAIIDSETFHAVQTLLAANNDGGSPNKTNTPRVDNIFRGKVICGCCGGKMQRRKGSGKADWHFFTCISNNRLGAGHCTGMYIRDAEIKEAILREAKSFLRKNETYAREYKASMAKLSNRASHTDDEVNHLTKMCHDKYADFVMGATTQDDLQQCHNNRDRLQDEKQQIVEQIESLEALYKKYHLLYNAVNEDAKLDELVSTYLQSVTVNATSKIDVLM